MSARTDTLIRSELGHLGTMTAGVYTPIRDYFTEIITLIWSLVIHVQSSLAQLLFGTRVATAIDIRS